MDKSVFNWCDWTVFAFYLIGIFMLGAFFAKRQTSTREFFKAGGRLGWFPVMVSLIASIFSGISFIGQPGRIFRSDASLLISVYIVTVFSFPAVAYVLLPFYRKLDVTTAYEYLEKRFSIHVRLLGSVFFILQRFVWMTLVVLAPSLLLSVMLNIRVEYCILMIGILSTGYTALGGMAAVIWTDVAQFFILIIGQVLILGIVIMRLDGGFMQVLQTSVADNKIFGSMAIDFTKPTFWTVLITGLLLGLGKGVDQVNVQRLMAARDNDQAKKSLLYIVIFEFPRLLLLGLMGLSLYAFYVAFPDSLNSNVMAHTDTIILHFVATEVPTGIRAVIVAAVFAAAMSSFDSGLNCLAATITVDWRRRLARVDRTDRQYTAFAKSLSLLLGIGITLGAIVIYKSDIKSIVDASMKYVGFLFGPLVGIFILGIATRRARSWPVIIAALISVAVVGTLDVLNHFRPTGQKIVSVYTYGSITVILTILIGYIGSLFGKQVPAEQVREYTLLN